MSAQLQTMLPCSLNSSLVFAFVCVAFIHVFYKMLGNSYTVNIAFNCYIIIITPIPLVSPVVCLSAPHSHPFFFPLPPLWMFVVTEDDVVLLVTTEGG